MGCVASERKRICFLITGLGVGGAERFLSILIPHIVKYEIVVLVVFPIRDLEQKFRDSQVTVVYLTGRVSVFQAPKACINLVKNLRYYKPFMVMTFLIHADLLGRVCVWLGYRLRLHGTSVIVCNLRNDYNKTNPFLCRLDKLTSFMVTSYVMNNESLETYADFVGARKFSVIENGVLINNVDMLESDKLVLKQKIGIAKDAKIILTVARLAPEKNLIVLLAALKKLIDNQPFNTNLIVIGIGLDEGRLRSYCNRSGLTQHVKFTGLVNEVSEYLRVADVFVLPSRVEGMSNALLEAMSYELPCIVSDIPQNRRVISLNKTGMLFDHTSFEHLASTLLYLLSNPDVAQRLGKCAREDIVENYSIEKKAEEYQLFFESIKV